MKHVISGFILFLLCISILVSGKRFKAIEAQLSNTETKFCKVRKKKQDTIILECNK